MAASGDRCPTCGYRQKERAVSKAQLEAMLRRNPPSTLAAMGEEMGVSRQRVHQLLRRYGLAHQRRGRRGRG